MRVLTTAFLCLLVAACSRGDTSATATTTDLTPAASGAETFFRDGLMGLEISRRNLRAKLGEPDSTSARPIQNRHDAAVTDSIIDIHYPGLSAEIYLATFNGNELTVFVTVTDNRYIAADAPVRIGMLESELPTVMGAASETNGSTLTYACDTCTALGNERVDVRVANGRVAAITVVHSID